MSHRRPRQVNAVVRRLDPMADKVLAIIRKTLLHENAVEGLSFSPATGEVVLSLLQPNDRYQYPDFSLVLTFSGVGSLAVETVGTAGGGEEVLGIECNGVEGVYRAEITIGRPGSAAWVARLAFSGLRYQRSPSYP